MTQPPHAAGDHCRKLHQTATELQNLIRQTFTRYHFGSGVANKGTVLFTTMSGIHGRAIEATSLEIPRHGTLWTIKQWERLSHYMLYVRCAAFFDALAREFLTLIPVGRPEDIQLASRRREQREMKNKKSNVANLLEAQPSLTDRQLGNSVGEGTERLRSPTERDPEGRQRGDVLRAMRVLWEPVAAHSPDHFDAGFRDGAKEPRSALTRRDTTSRDRTVFLPARARVMQDTPQQNLFWECSTVQDQGSVWTSARCAWWSGRASRVWARTSFPLVRRRPYAFERAGAVEVCGPEDLSLDDLQDRTASRGTDCHSRACVPRQRVELGEPVTEPFRGPGLVSQRDGDRVPTDEVCASLSTSGH